MSINRKFVYKLITGLIICGILFLIIFNSGRFGYYVYIVLLSLLSIVTLFFITKSFLFYKRFERNRPRHAFTVMSARFVFLFFLTGTLLSAIALDVINRHHYELSNNVELVFRSMILSIDLFLLDLEGNIIDHLPRHEALRSLLVIQAFLSFFCTLALFVNIVFTQLKALWVLNFSARVSNEKKHLYLFFGVNEAVKILVSDVKQKDPKALIVLVDFFDATKSEDDETIESGFTPILNMFTMRSKTFHFAEQQNVFVAASSRQFFDITDGIGLNDENDIIYNNQSYDLFDILGLNRIKELIKQLTKKEGTTLNLFFFSDNYRNNLRNIVAVAKDTTLRDIADGGVNPTVKIFCRSRYNVISKVVEDLALKKNFEVITVDSTHLAIELIKKNIYLQPVKVVKTAPFPPTSIQNELNSLIIGFEEEGQDAFKFIYEFGRFVSKDSALYDIKVHKPKIKICGKNINNFIGRFVHQHPGIDFSDDKIEFVEATTGSEEFYTKILTPEFCAKVNYIIITAGKDYENISLASSIFNYIRRFRLIFDDLLILVRCNNDENYEIMTKIAHHYNSGYDPLGSSFKVINIYGMPKEIYSFDTIVNDFFRSEGKKFHKGYQPIDYPQTWEQRRKESKGLDGLRQLRRRESQDMANAFHGFTKLILFNNALSIENEEQFESYKSLVKDDTYRYSSDKDSSSLKEVIDWLAVLEHVRWMASHELLGYSLDEKIDGTDPRRMKHGQLRLWNEMEMYRKNDGPVVKNTILLNNWQDFNS